MGKEVRQITCDPCCELFSKKICTELHYIVQQCRTLYFHDNTFFFSFLFFRSHVFLQLVVHSRACRVSTFQLCSPLLSLLISFVCLHVLITLSFCIDCVSRVKISEFAKKSEKYKKNAPQQRTSEALLGHSRGLLKKFENYF